MPFVVNNFELFIIERILNSSPDTSLTRYRCECGYIFFVSNCGLTTEEGHGGDVGLSTSVCPVC